MLQLDVICCFLFIPKPSGINLVGFPLCQRHGPQSHFLPSAFPSHFFQGKSGWKQSHLPKSASAQALGRQVGQDGVVKFVLAWSSFSDCFLAGENTLMFSQGCCGAPSPSGGQIPIQGREIFLFLLGLSAPSCPAPALWGGHR